MRPLLILLLCLIAGPSPAQAQGAPAELTPAGEGIVRQVVGGDTVVLEDGRRVRLVSLIVPRGGDGDGGGADGLAARSAAELGALVGGRAVMLYLAGRAQDRYGRVLAHLVRDDGLWVQGEMLRRGLARVHTYPDSSQAIRNLRQAEGEARGQGLGLWSDPLYQPRQADQGAGRWGADIGTFQIVRGEVVAAARVRERVYLNFGRDWRTDFTVEIEARDLRRFGTSFDPLTLQGRTVEVRGWVEERNGPVIRATHPEQIEPVDP